MSSATDWLTSVNSACSTLRAAVENDDVDGIAHADEALRMLLRSLPEGLDTTALAGTLAAAKAAIDGALLNAQSAHERKCAEIRHLSRGRRAVKAYG